jgi:cell division septation protein DedD
MKYNNGLIVSTVVLALMATGCVKKADNLTTTTEATTYNTTPQVAYDTTTYETATPIIYNESAVINGAGTTYSEVIPDNTLITTGNGTYGGYQEIAGTVVNSTDTYSTNNNAGATTTYGSGAYSSTGGNTDAIYSNPYGNQAEVSNNSYSTEYSTPTTSPQGGGIHLQIAALKNYYAAEEFKNSLSLDSKYTAYVQRGVINKVIISGISSVAEANRLKERRFPGAFIVRNSGGGSTASAPSAYGSSSSYSSPSYSNDNGGAYTVNNDYGYNTPSSSSSTSGIGVQIGAFSSRSKAQRVANANNTPYQAVVKQGTSRGRTIYRVVLTGFSSRSSAKRALSSGQIQNGFVTTNY